MSSVNYVCIKNGDTIKRVLRSDAKKLVLSGNWNYCPRKLWKETVRDASRAVIAENVREAVSAQDKPIKPTKRTRNPKGKSRKGLEKSTKHSID